jgi:hypothetical protein
VSWGWTWTSPSSGYPRNFRFRQECQDCLSWDRPVPLYQGINDGAFLTFWNALACYAQLSSYCRRAWLQGTSQLLTKPLQKSDTHHWEVIGGTHRRECPGRCLGAPPAVVLVIYLKTPEKVISIYPFGCFLQMWSGRKYIALRFSCIFLCWMIAMGLQQYNGWALVPRLVGPAILMAGVLAFLPTLPIHQKG